MQSLKGKLVQADLIIPQPNKTTGLINGEPHISLSVMASFSKFGRIVPDVVTVKVPTEEQEKYNALIGKDIEVAVYFPTPQYSLQSVKKSS